MYWDNEKKPSVEVPLGDFFGIRHCKVRYFTSPLLTVNPGDFSSIDNQGLNSYFTLGSKGPDRKGEKNYLHRYCPL